MIALFVIAAVGLYVINYVIPKTQGLMVKTTVIQYGDLPVSDRVEMILIRKETLYYAERTGQVDYLIGEGAKVRTGVQIVNIGSGETVSTKPAIERVKKAAGDNMKISMDGIADYTGIVSFYSDGFEKKLSPKSISKMKASLLDTLQKDCEKLKRKGVNAGDPIYKIVDNTLWRMVYWLPSDSEIGSNYEPGRTVQVDFGTAVIDAKVEKVSARKEGVKVILRSDIYYENLARQRVVSANVIFAHYKGLIAPFSSIVQRGTQDGVFVKQRNGSYKWVPVKVEQEIKSQCILTPVSFYNEEGNEVLTVNYYDELLVEPAKEGYK